MADRRLMRDRAGRFWERRRLMDADGVAEQPHRGNGVPEMTVKMEKAIKKDLKRKLESINCV